MVRLGLVLVLLVALLRAPFQLGIAGLTLSERLPCPARPLHTQPDAFHFTPGLTEHQSWIEAAVPEPDATDFVLCLDGSLQAEGIGHTPVLGRVEASVHTTWVDAQWLLGALSLYEDPRRWDLGYTTYTLRQNQGR